MRVQSVSILDPKKGDRVQMTFLTGFVALYVVSMCAIVLVAVENKEHRLAMFILGLLAPFLIPVIAIVAVFTKTEAEPCPARLETVEREIDEQRIQVFGGEPKVLLMAQAWEHRYREFLAKSAESIQELIEHRKVA